MTESNQHKEWFALDHSHQKWNALDGRAREAASLLGYTQEDWDSGRVTHLFLRSSWEDLNAPQRDAAQLLGLTPDKWTTVASNVRKNHPEGLHEEEKHDSMLAPSVLPSPFPESA